MVQRWKQLNVTETRIVLVTMAVQDGIETQRLEQQPKEWQIHIDKPQIVWSKSQAMHDISGRGGGSSIWISHSICQITHLEQYDVP